MFHHGMTRANKKKSIHVWKIEVLLRLEPLRVGFIYHTTQQRIEVFKCQPSSLTTSIIGRGLALELIHHSCLGSTPTRAQPLKCGVFIGRPIL